MINGKLFRWSSSIGKQSLGLSHNHSEKFAANLKKGADFYAKLESEYLQIVRYAARSDRKVTCSYRGNWRTGCVADVNTNFKGLAKFPCAGAGAGAGASNITLIHAKGAGDILKILNGNARAKSIISLPPRPGRVLNL